MISSCDGWKTWPHILHLLLSRDGACCLTSWIWTGLMACFEYLSVMYRNLDLCLCLLGMVPPPCMDGPDKTTEWWVRVPSNKQHQGPRYERGQCSPSNARLAAKDQPHQWVQMSSANSWNHENTWELF